MKKQLAVLLAFFALGTWSYAQSNKDKDRDADDAKAKQAQKHTDNDNDADDRDTGKDRIQFVEEPKITNMSNGNATLEWKTNHVASTNVHYGTNRNDLDQVAYQAGGATEHRVQLSGLQPGKTYFYEILRRDKSVRKTGEFQFNESGAAPASAASSGGSTAAPVALTQQPMLESVADTSAVVVWGTNAKSSSKVRFGTEQGNLSRLAEAPWGETTHRVTLKNLQPNTTYYFSIESGQAQGTGTNLTQTIGSFQTVATGAQAKTNVTPTPLGATAAATTAATTPTASPASAPAAAGQVQLNGEPTLESVGAQTVTIAWTTTGGPSNSVVHYGTDRNNLNQSAVGNWSPDHHRVFVQNLTANQTYYFTVESNPGAGRPTATSQVAGFQTIPMGTAAKHNVPLIH